MQRGAKRAALELVRDKTLETLEPFGPTEFELQAQVWCGLRALGINARGEVKTRFAGRAQVRFDIAVFEGDALVGIVEVKRRAERHALSWGNTRQGKRYTQFGVPIRFVSGLQQVEHLLSDAKAGRLWPIPAEAERVA